MSKNKVANAYRMLAEAAEDLFESFEKLKDDYSKNKLLLQTTCDSVANLEEKMAPLVDVLMPSNKWMDRTWPLVLPAAPM